MALQTSRQQILTSAEVEDFKKEFGFSGEGWLNSRNAENKTPLQEAIVLIYEGEIQKLDALKNIGVKILSTLLEIGANPSLNIDNNKNASIAEQDTFGWNAIGFAASLGVIEACLIIRAKDPECIYALTGKENSYTPLLVLVQRLDRPILSEYEEQSQKNCVEILKYCAREEEGYVNSSIPTGGTMLACSVRNNWPNATELLLELKANPYTANGQNIAHILAFHNATNVFPIVSDLNPELFTTQAIMNGKPVTPLMIAIDRSNTELVRYILQTAWPKSDLPLCIGDPLVFAALSAVPDVVKLLIDIGWDVNDPTSHKGSVFKQLCSPEVIIDKATKIKIAKILISSPTLNPFEVDGAGQNVIHHALELGGEIVNTLIEMMKDRPEILNKANREGMTYLSKAVLDDNFSLENFKKLCELNPTILDEVNITRTFIEQRQIFIMNTKKLPIPQKLLEHWEPKPGLTGVYDGIPIPTNYIIYPDNKNVFIVPVNETTFTIACKSKKEEKAEYLSTKVLPFTTNTGSNNLHHATQTNAKIMHNCLINDPEGVNKINCSKLSPLGLAASQVARKPAGHNTESKKILAELLFHGASITSEVIKELEEGAAAGGKTIQSVWEEFDYIKDHAAEIHAQLHPEEVITIGLGTIDFNI